MAEQIAPEIKEERSKKVISLSNEIQENYNKSYIGQTVEVLIEEKEGEYYKGHTRNYLLVHIKSEEKNMENQIIKVKIENAKNEILLGIIKQENVI